MSIATRSSCASVIEHLESRQLMSAVISSVTFSGTVSAPVITIKGNGFGAKPKAIKSPSYLLGTGADYAKNTFLFRDETAAPLTWTAGITGNYIGLTVSKYSNKLITYGIGSGLAEEAGNYSFNVGDSFEVGVNGATAFGTVALDGSNTIPVAANVNNTITKNKVPFTATAGAKLKGSFLLTLTNTGNLAAANIQSITVYAADANTDLSTFANATVLKMIKHGGSLAAGSVHKIGISFTTTAPAAGEYLVAVVTTLADGTLHTGDIAFLTVS